MNTNGEHIASCETRYFVGKPEQRILFLRRVEPFVGGYCPTRLPLSTGVLCSGLWAGENTRAYRSIDEDNNNQRHT